MMIVLWATTNYLTNVHFSEGVELNVLFNSGAFLFAMLAILAGTLFSYYFPVRRTVLGRERALLSTIALALVVLSLTPLGAGTVQSDSHGDLHFEIGKFIALYVIGLCLFLIIIVRNLWLNLKQGTGGYKQQASLILFGFGFAVVFGIISNIVVPAVVSDWNSTEVGPLLTIVLVASISYAIVRHRLFDLRLVIARSLGYIASVAMLAGLYGVVVFGIANVVFDLSIPLGAQITLAAATGFSGLIFPYMKKRFDRLTNTLFYRDAYAPEELFRQLNTMLVSSLDMRYLMTQSVTIIETTLKAEFALVGLRGEGDKHRIFTKHKINFSPEDIALVRQVTPQLHHQKVIVADYLDDPKLSKLQELMRRNNVGVIVRLTQNARSREDSLGYLILGNKKSGNPYTQQDIRVLDTVANELIIAIQNALHYEEIQQFNLVLQGRVDEATRKFRRSNEKLKALDETKDDFISMASHQLRTPLTSVKGYLSMVLEGDAGKLNATQHKMLQQAFTSSQRMVYLIADLLNVSRLRTGKFIIEQAPTNLAVMIEEEIAQLVEAAKVKDIELTYNKPKDFPELLLDETKTRQVIMNLVDNAIYYTPTGGHIKVQLVASDKTVELRVIDDGIGVPKSEQHHLFTKFYRAGNARKARPDGTGLGLFMAKKVVLAQSGSIIFESKENVGSTFGFSFPRTKLAVVTEPVPVAALDVAPQPKHTQA